MFKKLLQKKGLKVLLSLLLLAVIATFICNKMVSNTSTGLTFNKPNEVPAVKVGLLLGTGKYLSNGAINRYYKHRIEATFQLFQEHKIKALVISGDNSRAGYDEPTDMRSDLMNLGVDSNQIYLDYAGFRTFDSMVRLKEIFGQDSVIIISQQFHNERAIYIGKKLNMVCYGYNAQDVDKYFGFKTMVREKLARVKMVLDFVLGIEPKFLGDKVIIP